MVEVNCENCGKIVNKHPAHFKKTNHHYCCRDCCTEHRRKINIKYQNKSSAYRKIKGFAEIRKTLLVPDLENY